MHRLGLAETVGRARSPLVGRDAELEQLWDLYRRVCDGSGCGASIQGEAGIGKTRLLEEFTVRVAETGASIGVAICSEYVCPPFAPLREVFAALGVGSSLNFDASLPPAQTGAEATKYGRYLEMVRLLRDAADAAPVVLAIDDLQWADLATLEFLTFLAPRIKGAGVMLLGAVRSDALERDYQRAEMLAHLGHAGMETMSLGPLIDDEMMRLLTNLLPRGSLIAASEIERLCALAEGKPYFAEELIQSLLTDRGARGGEIFPQSIRASVLTRFERLTLRERHVLLCAAVIGRVFDIALLADVTGIPVSDVCDTIVRARTFQLVDERRELGDFSFRHALVREILYRELLVAQARAVHAKIAESLEARSGNGDSVAIAYHWTAAGDLVRATDANERAGDVAAARDAYRDAAVAYRRAIDADTPDRDFQRHAMLCRKLSNALCATGDELDESCEWALRAVQTYEAAGEHLLAAETTSVLARRYYQIGQPERAIEVVEPVLAALRRSGPANADPSAVQTTLYELHVLLANIHALQERSDAALSHLSTAEATLPDPPPARRQRAVMVRAEMHAISGHLADAFADYEEGAAIARAIGDDQNLTIVLVNKGGRATSTGHTHTALEAYNEVFRVLEERDIALAETMAVHGAAFVHLLAGDLDEVRRHLVRGSEIAPGTAHVQMLSVTAMLRLAYLRDEELCANDLQLTEALDRAYASGESRNIGMFTGCLAAYYDAIGRPAEAVELRTRALERLRCAEYSLWLLDQLATSTKPREVSRARELIDAAARDPDHLAANAHLCLFDARVERRKGDTATCRALAKQAAEYFERMHWPWEQAQALELAGDYAGALEICRARGYRRDERRLVETRRRVRHRTHRTGLTPRESEVARLAVAGKSNREIAAELFISERTVETHLSAIFDRFDLTSRSQLQSLVATAEP